MIIHDRFIYVHIPKTGGSSIQSIIGDPIRWHALGHISIEKIYKNMKVKKQELPVICYVRNPYDRLISAYHYCYGLEEKFQWPGLDMSAYQRRLSPPIRRPPTVATFERFMQNVQEISSICSPANLHLFKTQISFVSINNKLVVDHIYRFENFKNDFNKMKKRFFIEGDLPHANKGPDRALWQNFYRDKKVKEKVDELYRADFEAFDYPMEIR